MGSGVSDCHKFFSNLAYREEDILRRFVRADGVMGALFMAFVVASWIYLGIGLGPLAWVGHRGEKWSFGVAQHGQMNQCDECFCPLGVGIGECCIVEGEGDFGVRCIRLWREVIGGVVGCIAHLFRASVRNACSELKPVKRVRVWIICVHRK